MMIYLKLGKLCAFCFEAGAALGATPFLATARFGSEWIIDLPYMRLIATPAAEFENRNTGCRNDERPDNRIDRAAARIAEDRS